MTEEQLNKIIHINKSINELIRAKNEIDREDGRPVMLTYCVDMSGDYHTISYRSRELLDEILKKYDKIIRKEIIDEICRLKKEALEVC